MISSGIQTSVIIHDCFRKLNLGLLIPYNQLAFLLEKDLYSFPEEYLEVRKVQEIVEKFRSLNFDLEEFLLQKTKFLREIAGEIRPEEDEGVDLKEFERKLRETIDKKKILTAHLIEINEIDKWLEKLREIPVEYEQGSSNNIIEKLEGIKQEAANLRGELLQLEGNQKSKDELQRLLKKLDENIVFIEESAKFYELYFSNSDKIIEYFLYNFRL
jgi:hypothetical protein